MVAPSSTLPLSLSAPLLVNPDRRHREASTPSRTQARGGSALPSRALESFSRLLFPSEPQTPFEAKAGGRKSLG
jgi:hypothetical protein